MRIVYGIQSTGKGHLSRFLGLKSFFTRHGHELLVIATGYEDPPQYFLDAVSDCRYARFRGISYVGDGLGGVSRSRTAEAFVRYLPELLASYEQARALIGGFGPDLVVSDFDPIAASSLVAPGFTRVGLCHQNALEIPGMYHPPGMELEKFLACTVVKLFTADLHHKLACHFYPENENCLPPIIRPAIRDAVPQNLGHIVIYHTLPGMLAEIEQYASNHRDRRIILYGYGGQDDRDNLHFESDSARFAADLASADAYVGTAGFQSISEAFYLGKKIAVRPVGGQYEQLWNAAQLEHHGMGRWCSGDLEAALDQELDHELHQRLYPWFRDGARICYERIVSFARPRANTASARPEA